jgi:hypothetical protein
MEYVFKARLPPSFLINEDPNASCPTCNGPISGCAVNILRSTHMRLAEPLQVESIQHKEHSLTHLTAHAAL